MRKRTEDQRVIDELVDYINDKLMGGHAREAIINVISANILNHIGINVGDGDTPKRTVSDFLCMADEINDVFKKQTIDLAGSNIFAEYAAIDYLASDIDDAKKRREDFNKYFRLFMGKDFMEFVAECNEKIPRIKLDNGVDGRKIEWNCAYVFFKRKSHMCPHFVLYSEHKVDPNTMKLCKSHGWGKLIYELYDTDSGDDKLLVEMGEKTPKERFFGTIMFDSALYELDVAKIKDVRIVITDETVYYDMDDDCFDCPAAASKYR